MLLQYSDPNFYEKTSSSHRFKDFFVKKLRCSEQSAEEITADFVFACTVDSTVILSARKIYSRGCTSKKIGAIIKEKGGGG